MHTVCVRLVVRPHQARGIDQRLFALGSRLGHKKLSLALDWSCLNASRRAYIQANLGALRRVGISRGMVRGEARYWAHPGLFLARLDRHLFSAWLMRITASRELGSVPALHEGTLATSLTHPYGGAPVLQESVLPLGERVTAFARADEHGNAALLEAKKLGTSPYHWKSST